MKLTTPIIIILLLLVAGCGQMGCARCGDYGQKGWCMNPSHFEKKVGIHNFYLEADSEESLDAMVQTNCEENCHKMEYEIDNFDPHEYNTYQEGGKWKLKDDTIRCACLENRNAPKRSVE